MKLEEVRQKIDAIDPQIRELLMERLDCSRLVAETKQAAGETNIYRPDREQVILQKSKLADYPDLKHITIKIEEA